MSRMPPRMTVLVEMHFHHEKLGDVCPVWLLGAVWYQLEKRLNNRKDSFSAPGHCCEDVAAATNVSEKQG